MEDKRRGKEGCNLSLESRRREGEGGTFSLPSLPPLFFVHYSTFPFLYVQHFFEITAKKENFLLQTCLSRSECRAFLHQFRRRPPPTFKNLNLPLPTLTLYPLVPAPNTPAASSGGQILNQPPSIPLLFSLCAPLRRQDLITGRSPGIPSSLRYLGPFLTFLLCSLLFPFSLMEANFGPARKGGEEEE